MRDDELLAALRVGDERAFRQLVVRYHASMVRVARSHVASDAVAEEVAQDAWIAVIDGLGGFEGRSSLRSWMFAILLNQARRRGRREARQVPFSSLAAAELAVADPAVDPGRFEGLEGEWPGHWTVPPVRLDEVPEARLDASELRHVVEGAIAALPPAQQEVVRLRDVEGWTPDEVCVALDLTAGNQRVLLHRGRAKVRAAVELHLERSVA